MSKIIIHNNAQVPDAIALQMVLEVVKDGRVSGDSDCYCYHSTFHLTDFGDIGVSAVRRNNSTDTFYIADESKGFTQEVA